MKKLLIKAVCLTLALLLCLSLLPSVLAVETEDDFFDGIEETFAAENLLMEDRPQVRWWLDEGYHTDETLRESIEQLYELGYGGVEILCLNDSSVDNFLYGWGTEEWKHDLLVVAEECGKRGMSVSFAAGPDWQPTFLYYGTNEDVAENTCWQDYYEDYALLRETGRDVLSAAATNGGYNVYENESGVLTIDPNVDVFNQGVVVDEPVIVPPGETVTLDLTSFAYEASGGSSGEASGGASGSSSGEASLMGTSVSRTKYTVGFENLAAVSVSRLLEEDADYTRYNLGVFFASDTNAEGIKLSAEGVEQFTDAELSVGGLVSYDAATGKYMLTWTNPYDFDAVLTPCWSVGVGHGTAADTWDYGYMLMVNHFSEAGADAWYAFLRSYILTDDMVELIEKYDIRWDLFIDSLEIGSLGRFYWSNELTDIFYDLNGYDVTPYLPALFSTSFWFEGIDEIENDMRDALTEAYIVFQERLSENLHESGGELRAQVSYGTTLTTSSAIRAVDVPETESLAFKFSVESFKLMSGGVHLAGKNEFSSETNNWLGVNNASFNDQLYVVYQQMAAGVNRTVWHGFETVYGSEAVLSWPNNAGGIGCQFGSVNMPTTVLERGFSDHITRLQTVLKSGQELVDVGIMQNDLFVIALSMDGDSKGLLTQEHSLQDKGYTWECFDSSYLWADGGIYGTQNADGTLGLPRYKAVVVWDEDLSLRAAYALKELADGGLYVIFLTDAAATTTGSAAQSDAELAQVIASIKTDKAHAATAASTEEIVSLLEGFGIRPRVGFENAVCGDYNLGIYTESSAVGEPYESYDGLWAALMEDDDASYCFIFNESVDYPIETEARFEGLCTPYLLNAWTGEVIPVADFAYEDGNTVLTVSLAPTDAAVYILRPTETVLAASSETEASWESGAITWNGVWHVSIEQWSRGEILTRTETRENLDPYTCEVFLCEGGTTHTATEYGYTTDRTIVFEGDIANGDLTGWKDMQAAGLSEDDLTAVSGIGTYTTIFTAERDGQTVTLDLGSVDGMVSVSVNGTAFQPSIVRPVVDISSAVRAGENELTVTYASNLTNTQSLGLTRTVRGMQESAPYYPIVYKEVPESYGLTGPVLLSSAD